MTAAELQAFFGIFNSFHVIAMMLTRNSKEAAGNKQKSLD
jgi:hypothetical protein